MGNETIYGCVNWMTGKVIFTTPHCVKYATGCVHWTGAHAGMVEVYVYACDDTYYSCIDWTTGKFEVSIPDDCCLYAGCGCGCFHPPDRRWLSTHGTYYVGDVVWDGHYTYPSYPDSGKLFICIKEHTATGAKRPAGGYTWWEELESNWLTVKENWDDYPPFGGYCLTPSYYKITLQGIVSCNGWPGGVNINKTYLVSGGASNCIWSCTTNEGVEIWLNMGITPVPQYPYVAVRAPLAYGNSVCDTPVCETQPCIFYFFEHWLTPADDMCTLAASGLENELYDCCLYEGGGSGPIPVGTGGTFSYTPSLGASAWAGGVDYIVGDIVVHGGSYYQCTSNHTSSSLTEPGVGANWETVWDLMDMGTCE